MWKPCLGVGKQNSQVLLSCFLHRGRLIPCWFFTHKVPECPELPQSEQFPSCLSPTIILFDQSSVSSPWGNWPYKHWQPSGRRYDGPHSDSVQSAFHKTQLGVLLRSSTRGCMGFMYGKNSHWRKKSRFSLLFGLSSDWHHTFQKVIQLPSYRWGVCSSEEAVTPWSFISVQKEVKESRTGDGDPGLVMRALYGKVKMKALKKRVCELGFLLPEHSSSWAWLLDCWKGCCATEEGLLLPGKLPPGWCFPARKAVGLWILGW